MSDTYGSDYTLPVTWTDLITVYAGMASTNAWVQNKSTRPILVSFSSSASAPTGGGKILKAGEIATGTAAHVWAKTIGTTGASVALGLV